MLRAAGHEVFSSDLVGYPGRDSDVICGMDFLAQRQGFGEVILTNPPYKDASTPSSVTGFSLGAPGHRSFPVRLNGDPEGAKRSDLIDRHLVRVWAGIERPPKFQREGWEGPRQTSETSPFAWFVFSPDERGASSIELRRMSWRVKT